jgi:general secretion pathway protein J
MTLVETLLGLVVVGMVMALGLATLNLVGRAGQGAAAEPAALLTIQDLLRLRLLGAMPLVGEGPVGRPAILFEGQAERMAFAAELPARFGVPGPAVVELRRQGEDLRLLWRPVSGAASGEGAAGRLLLAHVAGLRLRYFGAPRPAEDITWRESWTDAAVLPAAIDITVLFHEGDSRRWPPLVVAPRLAGPRGGTME